MKKYVILSIILASNLILFAQMRTPDPVLAVKKKLDYDHPDYNPVKAFTEFSGLAQQGNAFAMNALGMMYMQGLGVVQDDVQAVIWFEKAARAGYGKAWFNWGTMYKNGDGVKQDFEKALEIFKQGAEKGFANSMYSAGFMLYKGLGCEQDYKAAIAFFKQGAAKRSPGSMHMLGLCYRNGYGTAANTDSARYWLSKAYMGGYGKSGYELAASEAENPEAAVSAVSKNTGYGKRATTQAIANKERETFAKVLHQSPRQNISGIYKGYIIRYDWSGKHILSKSELKLQLDHQNGKLSGQWTEGDTMYTDIQGAFTDSALVFNNTQYQRTDHYNPKTPLPYRFKDARLQIIRSADSVFIAGNLQLWSVKKREPERPMYISLVRQSDMLMAKDATRIAGSDNNSANLLVYPNPFESSINTEFVLENAATVNIQLADMTGKILYHKHLSLQAGQQKYSIETNIPAGAYLLRLSWAGTEKTAIVIKK